MKKVFMSIVLTMAVCGLTFGQAAQSGTAQSKSSMQMSKDEGWVKIGTKTVNLSEEKGIFNWDTDREKTINANEKYSAIKFKTKDATVNLTNVEVEYEDGKKENLSVNSPIRADADSKVLSLGSANKELDKITFNYRKDESASADKVQVELWGLKADAASGMGKRSGTDVDRDKDLDRGMSDTSTRMPVIR